MEIEVLWDNEQKTVIRYEFPTRWTWDDFYTAKTAAYNMLNTVNYKVGIIFNAPDGIQLPENILTHSRIAFSRLHPNTLCVGIVVGSPYLRTVLTIFTRLSRKAADMLILVDSLADARTHVHHRVAQVQAVRATEASS